VTAAGVADGVKCCLVRAREQVSEGGGGVRAVSDGWMDGWQTTARNKEGGIALQPGLLRLSVCRVGPVLEKNGGCAGQRGRRGRASCQEGTGRRCCCRRLPLWMLQGPGCVRACVRAGGGRADLRWDADEMGCRRCLAWSRVACVLLAWCCWVLLALPLAAAACQVLWGSPGQSVGVDLARGVLLLGVLFCGAGYQLGRAAGRRRLLIFRPVGRLLSS